MNLLGFQITKMPKAEVVKNNLTVDSLLDQLQGGYYNKSLLLGGEQRLLTRDLTVSYSAVYRCATLIASVIAGLPLQVLERKTLKVIEGSDSPSGRVSDLFERGISKEMSNFTFLETMLLDVLLDGNSFMKIHRDSVGRLEELELSIPTNTQIQRAKNRMLVYGLYFEEGIYEYIPYNEVIHIMMPRVYRRVVGSGYNLMRNYGVSPAQAVSGAVAIGLMGDKYVEDYFNGSTLQSNIIISVKGELNDDTKRDQLQEALHKKYVLGDRSPALLPPVEITQLKDAAQSGELKALREFQVEEVSRAFGVPAPLVGVAVTQWGSGIEQLSRLFLRNCLNPYLERIESNLTDKLLPKGFIAKFDVAELQRGDLAVTGGFLRNTLGGNGVQAVITVNESRTRYLGLPSVEGGDTLHTLSNPEFKDPYVDPNPIDSKRENQ